MWINLKDKKLIVTFKYDPKILPAVRSITGRVFNLKEKHWEVPLQNIDECLATLEPLGFSPTLEVKEAAEKERSFFKEAELIRAASASLLKYDGHLPLYDFQKTGALFLRALPFALLADAPGLGKTLQTFAALENIPGPHLILAPSSLKFSWRDEALKWIKDKVIVIDGTKIERNNQWFYASSAKYVIANYELLLRDLPEISKTSWQAIVCDEATRISNSQSKTVRALKTISSSRRIALTGTPISNSPLDLYSIIDWLSPKILGTLPQFTEKYCILDNYFRPIGFRNLPILKEKVARFMLRRTKEEVLEDFPKKTSQNIFFPLSEGEKFLYQNLQKLIISELSSLTIDKHSLPLIPVKMLRLKQLTDHPALISEKGYSSKLETLKELLRPIVESGEKVIIFTQFAEMLKILEKELAEYLPLSIYGEVSSESRQALVSCFNSNEDNKIMLMTEAGAYGLNLQSASAVIHYDSPWSIAKLQQREDRAHRIGQKKPVTVYSLIAKGTIDEYVAKVLFNKQKSSLEVLDDENRLMEAGLSEEDIKAILRL